MAPNVLTFLGFLLEIVSFIVSFIVSDQMQLPAPAWLCFFNAACTFLYQTLDNLDGKQAVRTHSSSALGQFFDHGCDALTAVSEILKGAIVFGWGPSINSFSLVLFLGIWVVLISWEEYVISKFILTTINVHDEGLLLLAILYTGCGIFPDTVRPFCSHWSLLVPAGVVGIGILISIIWTVFSTGPVKRAVLSGLAGFVSVTLKILPVVLNPAVVENVWFIMTAGYCLQYLSQTYIIARIAQRPIGRLYPISLIVCWAIDICFIVLNVDQVAFHQRYMMWLVVLMVVFDLRIVIEMAHGLDLPIFTLPARKNE
jgi:phosphatidylglycerophosphate synthase